MAHRGLVTCPLEFSLSTHSHICIMLHVRTDGAITLIPQVADHHDMMKPAVSKFAVILYITLQTGGSR